MRVSIHQPNFFPWLGIFQRIYDSDMFVFFDHVQANGGRSWVSRNKINISGKEAWLTMPVKKSGRFGQKIIDVEINYEVQFVDKHLKTLQINYGKARHFKNVFPMIEQIYSAEYQCIAEFNKKFIESVCGILNLDTSFIESSQIIKDFPHIATLKGNDLVLEICLAVNADAYLSGDGCQDFILPDTFAAAGVDFMFQNYKQPIYEQNGHGDFVSHLSIIDALFNIGADGVKDLLNRNSVHCKK